MLKNYLRTAYRNFINDWVYSSINVAGLSIGLASAILIFSYVSYQESYDGFHEKKERVYRFIQRQKINGIQEPSFANSLPLMGPLLKSEYPEIIDMARIKLFSNLVNIQIKDAEASSVRNFPNITACFGDPSLFTVFSFNLIDGLQDEILRQPNTVVISSSTAEKFFGEDWESKNILGKKVLIEGSDDDKEFYVQGVFEDVPDNSHIRFDCLVSFTTISRDYDLRTGGRVTTYILTKEGVDGQELGGKILSFLNERFGEMFMTRWGIEKYEMWLQPLENIHLQSGGYKNETQPRGDRNTVDFLMALGMFICFIGWANYVNITTARSVKRMKEIGIRKVSGASGKQLVMQFITESVMINLAALFLALTMAQVSIPLFSQLTGQKLSFLILNGGYEYFLFGLFYLSGAIISGALPAFLFSRYKITNMTKGKMGENKNTSLFRSGMVAGNLMVSFLVLTITLTVYKQYHYMLAKDLGLDIDQKLAVRVPVKDRIKSQLDFEAFRNEMEKSDKVKGMTASFNVPGAPKGWDNHYLRLKDEGQKMLQSFEINKVDYDFFSIYDIDLKVGRYFDRAFPSDSNAVIVTERFVEEMGFESPANAMGEKVFIRLGKRELEIIGVVKDINYFSSKIPVQGHTFLLISNEFEQISRTYKYYTLVIDGLDGIQEQLAEIEQVFVKLFPDIPFEYFFVDEYYNRRYANEKTFSKVFGFFSGLAILVTVIGLAGLIAYTTSRKTKEIGIRKVLGASVQGLLLLLSSNVLKLVLVAVAVGAIPCYYIVEWWLSNYSYRIDQDWTLFMAPALVVVAVTMVTVVYIILRAATANPARSLRYE